MDSIRRGLRSSLLLFKFSPGLAVSAIVALGMGIGFTTAMFSIVHGVFGRLADGATRSAARARDVAVRMALGATRRQIVIEGLTETLCLSAAAFAAAIEGIRPADASLLSSIAGALAVTVLAAVITPARRAARLEIVKALRVD